MMKKRKGFTLVELLAVIVILAVIVLIATPTILNVIENVRREAAVSSALGIVSALEKKVAVNGLNSSNTKFSLPISEGNLRTLISTHDVHIKNFGNKDSGIINMDERGIVTKAMFLINDYYICYTPKEQVVNKKGETTDFGDCNGMSIPDIVTAYQINYTNESYSDVGSTIGDNLDRLYRIFSSDN